MDEVEDHERRVAFEKTYVLRSEYERDLKLAGHDGIVTAATFCVFVVPVVLAILFFVLQAIGWIKPGEFGIS